MSTSLATADLAEQINAEHDLAFGKATEALEHARRAGELLVEAKARVPHGAWLEWVRDNCSFSIRTAQGYLRLAARWPELQGKCARPAHLGVERALQLLSDPRASDLEDQLAEWRSWGGEALADRWTGSREDAEDATRLLGERIGGECSAIGRRLGVDPMVVCSLMIEQLRWRAAESEAAR